MVNLLTVAWCDRLTRVTVRLLPAEPSFSPTTAKCLSLILGSITLLCAFARGFYGRELDLAIVANILNISLSEVVQKWNSLHKTSYKQIRYTLEV